MEIEENTDLNDYLETSPELVFIENKTRRRLLALFFRRPVSEWTVDNLSKMTDENESDIKEQIGEFIDLNMIEEVEEGVYKTNRESEIMRGYLEFSNEFLSNSIPDE